MGREEIIEKLLGRTGFDVSQIFSIAFGFFSASLVWVWIPELIEINLLVKTMLSLLFALVLRGLIKNMRFSAEITDKVRKHDEKDVIDVDAEETRQR